MKEIVIPLDSLKVPREICDIMEKAHVKWYTYTFISKSNGIINHGKTSDSEWKSNSWRTRIYRKAGGINGWPKKINCKASNDMSALMEKYLPNVMKDEIIIVVHDYTQDLQNKHISEIDRTLLNEEDKLVKSYVQTYGTQPILNIKKTQRYYVSNTNHFNSLFCA